MHVQYVNVCGKHKLVYYAFMYCVLPHAECVMCVLTRCVDCNRTQSVRLLYMLA